uniref:HAT C-terminal dimerisation domain-containing protein n=1 Tax=Lactuca sativa TaxID=4236 RepID=A0A9R1XXK2_LACSA|nr:hypothetical protein LSAT_V11C100007330 [Lactuca sativa]
MPRLHFEENFNADKEVKCGLYDVIERMYDRPTMVTIHEQLVKFNESIRMFGISAAVLRRKKMQPAKWWSSYGDECPKLQHLAIRVLSLTCSATGCERNWSTFDHIHSKKRNRLEQQRLNALVFVKYNINLDTRLQKRKERGETYDPICLSDMESDDEWITEKEDDEGTTTNKRMRGPRNLNKVSNVKDKAKSQLVDLDDEDEEEGDHIGFHETTVVEDEDEDDHFIPECHDSYESSHE